MSAFLPYPEYVKSLPKKFSGSGALIFDADGKILLLHATYGDGWGIPGGILDADESPRAACIRECREEIGLEIIPTQLLCLDYKLKTSIELQDDSYQFIWDGGVLSAEQIKQIRLNRDEHSAFRFVTPDEAMTLLKPAVGKRLPHSLLAKQAGKFVYTENGEAV